MSFAREQEYNQYFTDLHKAEEEFEKAIESLMEEFDLTWDEAVEKFELT